MADHELMIKLATEGRTPLAMAMLEDESVREASAKRAEAFLDMVEEEKNNMPEWMWNILWFVLGAFAWFTIDPTIELVNMLLKVAGFEGIYPQ